MQPDHTAGLTRSEFKLAEFSIDYVEVWYSIVLYQPLLILAAELYLCAEL